MHATRLDPELEERRYRQHPLRNLIAFKYGLQILIVQKFNEHSKCITAFTLLLYFASRNTLGFITFNFELIFDQPLSYVREFLGLSKYTVKHSGAKVNCFLT